MKVVEENKIWQFDVDDTLITWDISAYPLRNIFTMKGPKGHDVDLIQNEKNINLLEKLSKVGWYIRVHSGSGWQWAKAVIEALELTEFVDEVTSKPLGNTDDRPPGDGLAYNVYRDEIP